MLRTAALIVTLSVGFGHAAQRHGVLHQGQRVDVVDRGGLALWQGDIVLGRTADLVEATRLADLAGTAPRQAAKGLALGTAGGRWPKGPSGDFEIPYVIENDPDNGVPPAITAFNQLLAGFFRAVPRGAQADYVAFNFDAGDTTGPCFSSVGRAGGRQAIGGARNCSVPRLLHELGHAMGLMHEQERTDRLKWITLAFELVDPWLANNYVQNLDAGDVGPYDFASIMHYGPAGFTKTGANVMETIPPGIDIGPSAYSRGDYDTLRRLYGVFGPAIVVDTHPSGLTVLVDGASTVTPATFNWPIGSTHTLDVAPGAQVLGGVVHVFGRWSSDSAATLATAQAITVAPGVGTLTQPSQHPAVSVYTASFARMKQVTLGTTGSSAGVGGTLAANPPPAAVPGVAGTYYRERQDFTLTPTPNAGAAFGRWSGTLFFTIATSTRYTPLMRGPLPWSDTTPAYTINAHFVNFPFATVKARDQFGDILGISGSVVRAGGTTSQRLPHATTDTAAPWTAGETATVTVPQTASPWAASVRWVLDDFGGVASTSGTLRHPTAPPSTTLVANYRRQFEPYTKVSPSCAGTIAVAANPDGWVDAGANMTATLTPAAGWALATWTGTLSGTGNVRTFAASDVPDLTAEMNIVAAPLRITSVSPPTVSSVRAITLEIFGQGFAAGSRVLVANVQKTPSSITANRIVVPLSASDYPATGEVIVTVQNRTASCSLNVSTTFETFTPDGSLAAGLDNDSDGIPNGVEVANGTNPLVKDNDVFSETLHGHQLFAMQQYRDFLGREGDASGVTFWTGQLASGAQNRGQMVETYFNSAEFQGTGAPVARLYFAYFLRIPDFGGLNFWIGQFRGGTSLETISNAFAGSVEFANRYGALNNSQFVNLVYQNVLGRAPDATGLAHWTGRLNGGMTRGQMMVAFSESAEYRALIDSEIYVTMMYVGMLRRAPDASGFSFWVGYRDAGNSGLALINGFLAAPEYRGRFLP